MVVCHCLAINDATIRDLLDRDALSVEEIGMRCGAGTECGACVDQVRKLAGPRSFTIRRAVAQAV
jgi:bacterioferritin-associated ferredoxin